MDYIVPVSRRDSQRRFNSPPAKEVVIISLSEKNLVFNALFERIRSLTDQRECSRAKNLLACLEHELGLVEFVGLGRINAELGRYDILLVG